MAMEANNKIVPWWLTLISGIAAVILGILLFVRPLSSTLFLVQVLGWYWFFTGIMHLVSLFMDSRAWGWKLFLGIVGIIAGLWIINNPITSPLAVGFTLVIIIGIQGIIYGIAGLIAAFQGGGFGAGALGVISIIFGIIILGSPLISVAALPWVLGAFALVGGIALIASAFMQKGK
jgi:uncharacterized membrane protein HdeD (DUF308 family)